MLSEREQSNLQKIPNTVIGIVAHVDAGKTTLSEAILYNTGVLRRLGSVDAGSTALDTDELEKARGITIFSSEAHFQIEGRDFTLLDTPGHVDFSAETERTFRVLDACVLVISAPDGVQAHTRTLFRLIRAYRLDAAGRLTDTGFAAETPHPVCFQPWAFSAN
jgi:small GTP-binding protein